jgi:hypothetical protein
MDVSFLRKDELILMGFLRGRLMGGGDPGYVRVEEKEEDQAEGQKVHVDTENDSAMVKAPTTLHAPDGVCSACNGG